MSVNAGERKNGKLEVLIKAKSLAAYTIQICSNEKWFPPQFNNSITSKMVQTATDIFIDCWTANNIRVDGAEERYQARKGLQLKAMSECNTLLALIQISQEVFHLKTKRIKFWGDSILNVKTMIGSWKESDRKRFESPTIKEDG